MPLPITLRRAASALLLAVLAVFVVLPHFAGAQSSTVSPSTLQAQRAAFVLRDAAVRSRVAAVLHRVGALGDGVPLTRTRVLPPQSSAATTTSAAAASVSTAPVPFAATPTPAPLNFSVSKGFDQFGSDVDYKSFVTSIYSFLTRVYGAPSPAQSGKTVAINYDPDSGEGYAPSADGSTGGTIYLIPASSDDYLSSSCNSTCAVARAHAFNDFNLTVYMLNAFHGRQAFAFDFSAGKYIDSWELGFSYAAALHAFFLYKGSPSDFDPSQLGAYLLPVYDLFNRPELGNAFFFSDQLNSPTGLGYYRVGMAQAAWLKVAVEDPSFFSEFNAAYYQRVAANSSTPRDLAALQTIAAGIVPTVEGLRFYDWYRRQYVLDTRVTTGEKLWVAVFASTNPTTGSDQRSAFFGFAEHFRTSVSGSEVTEEPIEDTGTLTASDETGRDITSLSTELAADNSLSFENSDAPGEAETIAGFENTGTPDAARITLTFAAGRAKTTAIFPYNVAGTRTAPSGFYGAFTPATAGTVKITANGTSLGTVSLQRGAFGSSASYISGLGTKVLFTFTSSAGTSQQWRYGAWAYNTSRGKPQSLAVLLDGAGTLTTVKPQVPANTLRMISLPLTPQASDEADVFGIDPAALVLARYRPELATGSGAGLRSDKYEHYPRLSLPVGPGRGYWIRSTSAISASVPGAEPARTTPFEVPLRRGWNQIGVPFNLSFSLDAVKVRAPGGTVMTYAQALAAHLLLPGVWRWKTGGGYGRVDSATTSDRQLVPLDGYFIYALPNLSSSSDERGLSLIFTSTSRTAAAPVVYSGGWRLSMAVASGTASDTYNAFGAIPNATDGLPGRIPAPKPPLPESALNLAFERPGNPTLYATGAGGVLGQSDSGGWAESFVPTQTKGSSITWWFRVSGAASSAKVTLNWGDTSVLPADWTFALIDETNNARTAMRSTRTYSYTSGGGVRRFRIEMRPQTTTTTLDAASLVRSWSAEGLSGSHQGQLALEVTPQALADGATATVRIFSGDTEVRVLAAGQALSGTTTHWTWDGRDEDGQSLPAGDYTARVEVETPAGSRDERETPLSLR